MRKKSFPAGGLEGGFMEEMAQQLGYEGQTKFKYGDVAEYIGGRENDTNESKVVDEEVQCFRLAEAQECSRK